jgi:hypothetical protein
MEKTGQMATRKCPTAAKFAFSGNSRGIKRDQSVEEWGRWRSITKNLPKNQFCLSPMAEQFP